MIELVFSKSDYCYQTSIDLGGDAATMELDTGSPITTISIPNLIQITGEPLFAFRNKANAFMQEHKPLSLGVYGSQVTSVTHNFLPYLVKQLIIDTVRFPYFLFWVDVTNLNSKELLPTSILFGYDYIRQGKKRFDENDDFHIVFDKISADTFSVEYALSNINERVNEISKLISIESN